MYKQKQKMTRRGLKRIAGTMRGLKRQGGSSRGHKRIPLMQRKHVRRNGPFPHPVASRAPRESKEQTELTKPLGT